MTTEDWIIEILVYVVIFLYGIVIGSFLNVCILRIPLKESIAKERSHCMSCGYQLAWYDLVPLFSYLFLGGKCRKCKSHISLQYPLVEALNGVLYVLIFLVNGWSIDSVIYCLLTSALIVLSVIDFRTYEIPFGINLFILALGLIHLGLHLGDWVTYGIGLVAVSSFMEVLVLLTKGRAMGGGDVKLMAAAGLLLGWKLSLVAFLLGCILGSVIHLIRMKLSGAEHQLAFGPYLSAGIILALLWGENFLNWYLGLFAATAV
jgi:leader peptidase (prepilin peptidase)/N-methyltransferase